MGRKTSFFVYFLAVAVVLSSFGFIIYSGSDECEVEIDHASIKVGDTASVVFKKGSSTYASDEELTWTSDDEGIATVNEHGIVTGVAPGTAKIKGSFKNMEAEVELSVAIQNDALPPMEDNDSRSKTNSPEEQTEANTEDTTMDSSKTEERTEYPSESMDSQEKGSAQNMSADTLQPPPSVDDPFWAANTSGSDAVFMDDRTGHAYALFNYDELELFTFDQWEAFCARLNGHLAIIDSEEENEFLYKSIRSTYNPDTDENMRSSFFGYTDKNHEGSWYWLYQNGGYENWADGQPNNKRNEEHYALFDLNSDSGRWNDSKIGVNSFWFICEWEP